MDKYLVVGSGVSGIAACELLKKENKSFLLYDENEKLDAAALRAKHPVLSEVKIAAGAFPEELYGAVSVVVLSPGVSVEKEYVRRLKETGAKISGEVELAFCFGKGRVAAITGTNGKTTTTALTGEILKQQYADVKVVGNIGIPYTSVAWDTTEDTVIVAEISSFQLETAETFAPKATAILNITPDHLDRHHTMDNYIAIKESITKNQGKEDICVLNYEDEALRQFGESAPCKVVYFSGARRLKNGYVYHDGALYRVSEGMEKHLLDVAELNILGLHNYENALAAWALGEAFGVPDEKIAAAMRAFKAVPHRIEFICEKRGVKFYNDSKGTNPDAAIKAIEAMERPTHLIGGGYDKHSTYDEWIESFGDKVKTLALIGETKQAIADTARAHGFTDIVMCESLEEAMDACFAKANPGEVILLSPACASWDMFPNYEVRGEQFAAHAREYEEA
ncbi:MAG: UDP-N-acetylmuramoyl-L-alanine--D-glutamate ligase [Lachnospiraceae bacterium]|nr:UDP-N-acetylmuramoyl-L-alanine--D-glutamate ligase [Lachnospiraceae bacterium]